MDDSSDGMSQDEGQTWVDWFCKLRGNEFFCEVPDSFIQDEFNLYGLNRVVQNYDYALDIILDNEREEDLDVQQELSLEHSAEVLYGLIHARFIVTAGGQQIMLEKARRGEFGTCPRVSCFGQVLLPVGLSDEPLQHTVKMYCPSCGELYFPKYTRHASIDGAYFGTTFPHLLVLQNPSLVQKRPATPHIPKIFGFRVHPTAQISQQRAAKKAEEDALMKQASTFVPEVGIAERERREKENAKWDTPQGQDKPEEEKDTMTEETTTENKQE